MGLVVGALDPRFGQNLGMTKGLGVVLFCYTVGLAAGSTFLSDLKRQWSLMLAGVVGLAVMAVAGLGLGRLFGLTPAHVAGLYAGVLTSPAIDAASTATHGAGNTLVGYALSYPVGVVVGLIMVAFIAKRRWPAAKDNTSMAEAGLTSVSTVVDRETSIRETPGFNDDQIRMSYLLRDGEMRLAAPDDDLHVGDQVLVAFVELITRCCRKEDRLFRFGGEEFLLLLPNTEAEGLRTAAQNLLSKVANELHGPGGAVTVSIGGAILHSGEHWESWLQRADECLYRAKSEGRNRAVIADAPGSSHRAAAGR